MTDKETIAVKKIVWIALAEAMKAAMLQLTDDTPTVQAQKLLLEFVQPEMVKAITQHTADLQAQLAEKDKEIERLKAKIERLSLPNDNLTR